MAAAAYIAAVLVGIAMVHAGNGFAVRYRDRLVSHANATTAISKALQNNRAKTAAALDFSGNLAGGIASTAAGYWAPAVFPIAIYRGWVGGIVSVDGKHRSRFATWPEASYYMAVMCLQLLPYILAGGAGVNIGLARVRPVGDYAGAKFFGVPREAWIDAARIYVLVVPLFAIASAFEFPASPN
ncbi:MAG TPA: stage II sporulation protein M [Candidatus Acidoferrales bacterium]|nr:stage II sporulation protein M [Candidatus Acidoferrales bacterium]